MREQVLWPSLGICGLLKKWKKALIGTPCWNTPLTGHEVLWPPKYLAKCLTVTVRFRRCRPQQGVAQLLKLLLSTETGDSLRSQKITSHLCVQTGTPFPYTVLRPPSARLGMLWWPSWSLKVKENKHCWGLLGNVHPSLTCIFFWLFSVFQYIPNYLWQKDTKGRSTKLPIQGFPVVRKPLGCG